MKKSLFLFLFFLALLANLTGIAFGITSLQVYSKPLIVPALIIYFIVQGSAAGKQRYLILIALFCSWVGDILLLFDSRPEFFLAGLSAFLAAHIFYILFFYRIIQDKKLKPRILLFLVVAIYYACLIYLLFPHLDGMKYPVLVYGIVISMMLLLALHVSFIKDRLAGNLLLLGATSFVISDSLLAVNKFYNSFPGAGIMVMVTYAIAQYSIMQGALQYLSGKQN